MQSHRLYTLTSPQQRAHQKPCTTRICPHKNSKIPTNNIFHEKIQTSPHPRTCTPKYRASITSRHQHKHATMTSITQHWNTITPVKRFYKPTRITPPGGRPTQTAERPGLVATCEHIDSIYQIFPRHSKTSPYPRTCTEKYRIKNVSSPA